MRPIQVIDCFSGAGGLSLGLGSVGLNVRYAFDYDQDSVASYARNIGEHVHIEDAYEVTDEKISRQLGAHVDSDHLVVVGGPPCQGFSVQRRGDDSDIRNHLVLEFMRLVFDLKPRLFMMENVSGLLSKRGQPYIDRIREQSDCHGYFLHTKKLNALDYGVPQDRRRVFIVGERTETPMSLYEFPEPDVSVPGSTTNVRDAIGDLQNTDRNAIANHIWDRLSDMNMKRIRAVEQGQGRDSLPVELQIPSQKNNPTHRHLDTYGRMAWDSPAPTITARFDSFTRGRFGHPVLDRTISLREGARIQSFPDAFEFTGDKVSVARQIGNAVPPRLASALGASIHRYFDRLEKLATPRPA